MPFTFSIPSSMVGLRTEVVTAYCPSERENQRWGRRLVGIIMSWSSPSETDRALTVTITHLFHGVFWPSPSISLPTHNRSQYTCRCVMYTHYPLLSLSLHTCSLHKPCFHYTHHPAKETTSQFSEREVLVKRCNSDYSQHPDTSPVP